MSIKKIFYEQTILYDDVIGVIEDFLYERDGFDYAYALDQLLFMNELFQSGGHMSFLNNNLYLAHKQNEHGRYILCNDFKKVFLRHYKEEYCYKKYFKNELKTT